MASTDVAAHAPPSPDKVSPKRGAGGPPFQPGRVRRASAQTRIFGHFMAEKNPRATWAVGVLKLERDPGGNVMRDTLWERVMRMGRFRSRLIVHRFGGHWQELPEEELLRLRDSGYLWSEVLTDGTGTDADVNRVLADTDKWKYDRNAPLWRTQYARKLADGSAAIIVTINHGVGDGVSLVATMLGLCDEPEDPKAKELARGSMAMPTKRAAPPKLGPATRVGTFLYGVYHGLTSSKWAPDKHNALTLADVTKPTGEKRIAHAKPIPLDEMKRIKNKFPGATINDVMMATLTAAMRAYFEAKGDKAATGATKVRGAFPVNLRGPKEPILRDGDPMNKWSYGSFRFDFKYKDRIELVWKVKHQVDKIKISPSPIIQYKLLNVLIKLLPRNVLLDQLLSFGSQATCQLSNVPGPSASVKLAGVTVLEQYFALISPVGAYIGLLSYAGMVSMSVNLDAGTGGDAELLAQLWNSEWEKLKEEVDKFPDTVPVPHRRWA